MCLCFCGTGEVVWGEEEKQRECKVAFWKSPSELLRPWCSPTLSDKDTDTHSEGQRNNLEVVQSQRDIYPRQTPRVCDLQTSEAPIPVFFFKLFGISPGSGPIQGHPRKNVWTFHIWRRQQEILGVRHNFQCVRHLSLILRHLNLSCFPCFIFRNFWHFTRGLAENQENVRSNWHFLRAAPREKCLDFNACLKAGIVATDDRGQTLNSLNGLRVPLGVRWEEKPVFVVHLHSQTVTPHKNYHTSPGSAEESIGGDLPFCNVP